MRKVFFIIVSFYFGNLNSQDSILTNKNLFPFILKVDSLNNVFNNSIKNEYYAIQQSTADYIRIITKDVENFIHDLKKGVLPSDILKKYKNSIIDKSVFITKTKSINYKQEELISLQSYDINNNGEHTVSLPFDINIFNNVNLKGKYFFTAIENKEDNTTRIDAFYILSDFTSDKINADIGSYLDYADLIIGKEKIFLNELSLKIPDSLFNPIDSLDKFFNNLTEQPTFRKDETYPQYSKRLIQWTQQNENISDSIFIHNQQYRSLIIQSLNFAKETFSSHPVLEQLIARYVSKYESLQLMRLSPKRGRQSFDSSPIDQQLKLCRISADLSNWGVFIKSLMNLMNDNMVRDIDNSMTRASRKTFLSELEKLPIDLKKLLIGISLSVSNTKKDHYWGSGDRIGKSIANSNQTKELVDAFIEVIKDDQIDQLNKLHFYNILKNVEYFTNDQEIKNQITKGISEVLNNFDSSISKRLVDANLELKNLLIRDSNELEMNFEIKSSTIGNLYTSYAQGDCWVGEFRPKNIRENIIFNLLMRADTTLSSIQMLCSKKEKLIAAITVNKIFHEFLYSDSTSVEINYIIDKTYVPKKYSCSQEIPEIIITRYSEMLDNSIMLETYKGKKSASWIVFENGDALLTQFSKDFKLENFKLNEILTLEIEKKFGGNEYYSFKIFNKNGQLMETPSGGK